MFVWLRINTDDEYDDEGDSIGTRLSRGGMRRAGDTQSHTLGGEKSLSQHAKKWNILTESCFSSTLPMIQRIFKGNMFSRVEK